MSLPLILVLEEIHEAGLDRLAAAPVEMAAGWRLAPEALAAALARAEGLVVRTSPLTAEMIRAAPGLKVISKHGVGCDNIATDAARAAGVPVTVTADANAQSVAEHTLALLLAAAKRLMRADEAVRRDYGWRGSALSADLDGRRILIAGYGRIGSRVAPLCAAFGMDVTIWDPILPETPEIDGYVRAPSLAAGLAGAGALSVHVPLTAETRNLIDRAALLRLAPGALVVNCARGGVVDEAALAALAADGHVGGVGSDVFTEEPTQPDNPLLRIAGAALSPHTAAMSEAGMRRMSTRAAENALDGVLRRVREDMLFAG